MTAGIGALLSDCDGVIVDSEGLAEDVLVEVFAPVFRGHDVRGVAHELIGLRIADILRRLEAVAERPLDGARRDALCREVDDRVAEAAAPMPGVAEVYRALGLPIAVVSNSAFPRLHRSVERAGLLPVVGPHVYSAEDVGRPKPAPDAYLHAARQLGVAPADCVIVEDSPTGVRAAVASGMRTLGFVGGGHVPTGHGDRLRELGVLAVFDRLSDLPALIASLD